MKEIINWFNKTKEVQYYYGSLAEKIKHSIYKKELHIWSTINPNIDFLWSYDRYVTKNRIWVSGLNIEHPFWSEQQQIKFRGWHDYFHFEYTLLLNSKGEYEVFKLSARDLDLNPEGKEYQILFYEIVLQAIYKEETGEFYNQLNYLDLSFEEMNYFINLIEKHERT